MNPLLLNKWVGWAIRMKELPVHSVMSKVFYSEYTLPPILWLILAGRGNAKPLRNKFICEIKLQVWAQEHTVA